jgi:hypothetical protein
VIGFVSLEKQGVARRGEPAHHDLARLNHDLEVPS